MENAKTQQDLGGVERRTWMIAALVFILLFLAGWLCNDVVERARRTRVKADLITIRNANVEALNAWSSLQRTLVTALARRPEGQPQRGPPLRQPGAAAGPFRTSPPSARAANCPKIWRLWS